MTLGFMKMVKNFSDMINEIICDTLLRKFEGNTSIALDSVREADFYKNIDPDFSVVEDHINFLIADRTLKRMDQSISLTTKGWFLLTNNDKVGYVAQKIDMVRREMAERENRLFFRSATVVCGSLLVIWTFYSLLNH